MISDRWSVIRVRLAEEAAGVLPLCLLWEEGGRRPDDGLLAISDQWSVIRARLAEEAAGEYRAVAV